MYGKAGLNGPKRARVREGGAQCQPQRALVREIDSKVWLASVCRMAEGGRRRKTVAHGDDPPPLGHPVVWMYFNLVPILHGQRLAGMLMLAKNSATENLDKYVALVSVVHCHSESEAL